MSQMAWIMSSVSQCSSAWFKDGKRRVLGGRSSGCKVVERMMFVRLGRGLLPSEWKVFFPMMTALVVSKSFEVVEVRCLKRFKSCWMFHGMELLSPIPPEWLF